MQLLIVRIQRCVAILIQNKIWCSLFECFCSTDLFSWLFSEIPTHLLLVFVTQSWSEVYHEVTITGRLVHKYIYHEMRSKQVVRATVKCMSELSDTLQKDHNYWSPFRVRSQVQHSPVDWKLTKISNKIYTNYGNVHRLIYMNNFRLDIVVFQPPMIVFKPESS